MPLTDLQIAGAKPAIEPYRLPDGGALYLEVRPSGKKLWRYRYRLHGKENIFALGRYFDGKRKPPDHMSLEGARTARDAARGLVRQGKAPSLERRVERLKQANAAATTFRGVALEWVAQNQANWTPYYLKQVERGLKEDLFKAIGDLPIKDVTAAHLLAVLQKIEKRGAKTVALLVRQWSSAIFRHAVSTLRAQTDPAAALRGLIKRDKIKHKTPLTREQIPALVGKIEKSAFRTTVIAMRLLLLTFVRPGELRCGEWSEFDLDVLAEWRIPGERMKMREMHIVPLSIQAIALFKELKAITGGSRYLFPNLRRPETVMTNTTLNRALERIGYGGQFSAHGFRATASTFLYEMGYREDLVERQLAHAERNKVRASYNQAEYLSERRLMMQQWADFIDGLCQQSTSNDAGNGL